MIVYISPWAYQLCCLLSNDNNNNQLQLNVSKSVVMLIGTRQINHHVVSVYINGQTLTQVSYTKYLGLFSMNLTWQKHTEYILRRARGKVHCLNRLQPLSDSILFRLYCGFILPILIIVTLYGCFQLHYTLKIFGAYTCKICWTHE